MRQITTVSLSIVFSFLAGIFVILLVSLTPSHTPSLSFPQKVGIASLFILCCCIGISLTFHPNWIRYFFSKPKNEETRTALQKKRPFKGHHPECLTFQSHTIQWKNKTWCAGCLGLFLGLCGAILVMTLYIAFDIMFTKIVSFYLLFTGMLILIIAFGEVFFQSKSAFLHIILNSLLPLCFFFVIIAVGGITGQFIDVLYTILLCFLWLDTRIHLSKWRHSLLCEKCSESCKMFQVTS